MGEKCQNVYVGSKAANNTKPKKNHSPTFVDPILFASGNLFKCHEEVLYLQPLIPPERFDIFSPINGGCSEGLGAF